MQPRTILQMFVLAACPAVAQAGLLADIAKAVSIAVITDAARASISSFTSTKVIQGNAFDRATVRQILNDSMRRDLADREKRKLFAQKVDFIHNGVVDVDTVLRIRRKQFDDAPTLQREVVSIDLIEVDPDKKFAAVSYTTRTSWRDKSGILRAALYKQVALFGSFRDSPRIHAVKEVD